MSNRRKVEPAVVRVAQQWRCPDCSSESGRPWRDTHGIWHLPVHHDDSCPALAGLTSVPVAWLGLRTRR